MYDPFRVKIILRAWTGGVAPAVRVHPFQGCLRSEHFIRLAGQDSLAPRVLIVAAIGLVIVVVIVAVHRVHPSRDIKNARSR